MCPLKLVDAMERLDAASTVGRLQKGKETEHNKTALMYLLTNRKLVEVAERVHADGMVRRQDGTENTGNSLMPCSGDPGS